MLSLLSDWKHAKIGKKKLEMMQITIIKWGRSRCQGIWYTYPLS
jgi:hypothetical protein